MSLLSSTLYYTPSKNYEYNDHGTITLEVGDGKKDALLALRSEVHHIGGAEWQILPAKADHPEYLFISCNADIVDRLWYCYAKCKVEIQPCAPKNNLGGPPPIRSCTLQLHWFNGCSIQNVYVGDPFPQWIRFRIKVYNCSGKQNFPELDANLKVVSGGKFTLIPVSRFCLATHSDYFRTLFFAKWNGKRKRRKFGHEYQDNQQPHLTIYEVQEAADFDWGAFQFMVNVTQVMGSMADRAFDNNWPVENRIALLRLADKYQLPVIADVAERMLINLGPGTMPLLALAEEFPKLLPGLKQHCLASIDPAEFGTDIAKNSVIRDQLRVETRQKLDEHLMRKGKKRKLEMMNGDGEYGWHM